MPGLKTTAYGTGDFRWLLNTESVRDAVTGMLDVVVFTAGTHYPNGFFPSGLACNIQDPLWVKPYTGASGEKLAFLVGDVEVTPGSTSISGAFLVRGNIKKAFLPVKTNVPDTAPDFYITIGA